jgi:hypothetical protein
LGEPGEPALRDRLAFTLGAIDHGVVRHPTHRQAQGQPAATSADLTAATLRVKCHLMASETKTGSTADGRPLWQELLPILQEINNYGGNFNAAFICRPVIEEIDCRAKAGDVSLARRADRMRAALRLGHWPQDPNEAVSLVPPADFER